MNTLILGYSNLARDLYLTFQQDSKWIGFISRFHQNHGDRNSQIETPDVIFNTIGGNLQTSHPLLWELNIIHNRELRSAYPKAKIVAFSSNAALEPSRSHFARIKCELEREGETLGISVIRVCNLYGNHIPSRCFPGKLVRNNNVSPIFSLPRNNVVPTPTDWLAKEIHRRFYNLPSVIAPQGITTTHFWGQEILERKVNEGEFDPLRPNYPILSDSGSKQTWGELWKQRWINGDWKLSVLGNGDSVLGRSFN